MKLAKYLVLLLVITGCMNTNDIHNEAIKASYDNQIVCYNYNAWGNDYGRFCLEYMGRKK